VELGVGDRHRQLGLLSEDEFGVAFEDRLVLRVEIDGDDLQVGERGL
jgi:hypothetical protein